MNVFYYLEAKKNGRQQLENGFYKYKACDFAKKTECKLYFETKTIVGK